MMKYLVASANSYGNVGDDVCGYSARHLIRQCDPDAEVEVTCPPFNETLAERADVIVLGGGGIFYDGDRANVDNYLSYLEYAQAHNKPNMALGIGVQGITTDWGKERYKSVLNNCDLVTVRSPKDKELLDAIGIQRVHATQDLGFLTDEWAPSVPLASLRRSLVKRFSAKPRLGLGLVDLKHIKGPSYGGEFKRFTEIVEQAMPRLCETFDVRLLVHSRDDDEWYKQLATQPGATIVPYQTIKDFSRFWHAYSTLDMVVGVRFHSIILGLLSQKPVVGIGTKGAKQHRLSEYDLPTLKDQFYRFDEVDRIEELFTTLPERFKAGEFKTLPNTEFITLKERVHANSELFTEVINSTKESV
jgi:polysaccharide pyruvyl transferase WcaK-like protein